MEVVGGTDTEMEVCKTFYKGSCTLLHVNGAFLALRLRLGAVSFRAFDGFQGEGTGFATLNIYLAEPSLSVIEFSTSDDDCIRLPLNCVEIEVATGVSRIFDHEDL